MMNDHLIRTPKHGSTPQLVYNATSSLVRKWIEEKKYHFLALTERERERERVCVYLSLRFVISDLLAQLGKAMALSVSLMQLSCVSLLHNNPSSSSSPVTLLPKSLFPCGISLKLKGLVFWCKSSSVCGRRRVGVGSISVNASLVEAPVLWAGRLCIFYALLKAGLAGSQANPLVLGGKINSLLFFSFGNLLHFYVR